MSESSPFTAVPGVVGVSSVAPPPSAPVVPSAPTLKGSISLNTQQLASIVRQVIAIVAWVFALLTQSVAGLHLPVAVSTTLGIFGTVILAVEHYVGDPSTGTPTPPA